MAVSVDERECAILRASLVSPLGDVTFVVGSDELGREASAFVGDGSRLMFMDLTAC